MLIESTTTLYALAAGASFAGVAALTPAAKSAGVRLGLVDRPGPRKVHRAPTPRSGGLAFGPIILVVSAALLLMFGTPGERAAEASTLLHVAVALVGAGAVWGAGLLDDLVDLPARYKLLVLLACAVATCATGATVAESMVSGLLPDAWWAAWPTTVLWLVAVPVAVNFIDGLDGLAAGIVGIAAALLAVVATLGGVWPVAVGALALAAACAAFLLYNRHPASVFMGDAGSLFLGFLLAGLCVAAGPRLYFTKSYVIPGLALLVPLIDTGLTFVRRGVLQRRSIFSAERGHVHHRLVDMGLTHGQAVAVLWGATLAAACIGLLALAMPTWTAKLGVLALAVPLMVGLFRSSGSVRGRDTLAALRRNRALRRTHGHYRRAFEEAQLRLRDARAFDAWWAGLCAAAEKLDFRALRLLGTNRDGTPQALVWETARDDFAGAQKLTADVPVRQRRASSAAGGGLRLEADIAIADDCLESAGQRLALFSRLVAEFNPTTIDPSGGVRRHRTRAGGAPEPAADLLAASSTPAGQPRVAVVHDFLYTYAGAERVLEQVLDAYPHADLFALFDFVPDEQRAFLRDKPARTSFLQRMPLARKFHRHYLPLMPLAVEQLDVSRYDVVLSSSYCVAKGVITRPDQPHICYCHSPVRFAWDLQHQYLAEAGLAEPQTLAKRALGPLVRLTLHYLRGWDVRSSAGVDLFLANSAFVGRRIRKVYRRGSRVLYPPVDTRLFTPSPDSEQNPRQDFYLAASRMVPYKRLDLIVEAFSRTPHRRLTVVGDGPDFQKVKRLAGPNVRLVGQATHEDLLRYMRLAKGFVFAAEEDFGIVPVEAMACGTPVVAYGHGGVRETVVDGVTGLFFDEQTPEALLAALDRFEAHGAWDGRSIRAHAEQFGPDRFRRELTAVVTRAWHRAQQDAQQGRPSRRAKQSVFDSLSRYSGRGPG